jgi:hypothetical protein
VCRRGRERDDGVGEEPKSYDGEKAWPSINHSTVSGGGEPLFLPGKIAVGVGQREAEAQGTVGEGGGGWVGAQGGGRGGGEEVEE